MQHFLEMNKSRLDTKSRRSKANVNEIEQLAESVNPLKFNELEENSGKTTSFLLIQKSHSSISELFQFSST